MLVYKTTSLKDDKLLHVKMKNTNGKSSYNGKQYWSNSYFM